MTKVLSYEKKADYSLEMDDYVPFRFCSPKDWEKVPLYWLIGNLNRTLVEMRLCDCTGAIVAVTVTCIGECSRANMDWHFQYATIEQLEGMPVCDKTPWKDPREYSDRFIREAAEISSVAGLDFISFQLNISKPIRRLYVNGPLCVGVDDEDTICAIIFKDLTAEQIEQATQGAAERQSTVI